MRKLFNLLKSTLSRTLAVAVLLTLLTMTSWIGLSQASFAAPSASNAVSPEDQEERAYDGFSTSTGIQEDTYQQRLQEGQDPEKMPKPYKRIKDAQGKEVPETSFVEKSVSKVRQLIDRGEE
ncbi:MAG: hypothetical protein KME13_25520 [Myxacorys californica WJT36-NPBG1]|jgi:hypothetical protein|nr:hypothetical protein [Myxacorys californica WJT36-NPBG1]